MLGASRHVTGRKMPAIGRDRLVRRRGCARAPTRPRRRDGSPFCGCSSCCGSPSSTMLFARLRRRRARWRATSGRPRRRRARRRRSANSGRAQSHAVPPSTFAVAGLQRRRAPRRCRRGPSMASGSSASSRRRSCAPSRTSSALRRRPSPTASSRLRMTLWLVAVTPTFLPACDERADHLARRCTSCPSPAAPGSARTVASRSPAMRTAKSTADSPAAGANVARPQPRRRRQEQAMRRGVLACAASGSDAAPVGHAVARIDRSRPRGRSVGRACDAKAAVG